MHIVNAHEAAQLTGLPERTIRRRVAEGVLPASQPAPHRLAIDVADLERMVGHTLDLNSEADLAQQVRALTRRVATLEDALAHLLDLLEGRGDVPSDKSGTRPESEDRVVSSTVDNGEARPKREDRVVSSTVGKPDLSN